MPIRRYLILVFVSPSAIMSLFLQSIEIVLGKWKGYNPKTNVHSFREYFQHCRCWFDSKKISTMVTNFWIPSMQLIKEFTMKAAFQLFGNRNHEVQTSFCGYLYVLLLHRVFEGYMQPSNARHMWLVPAASYRPFLKKYI
eukprot:170841_1